MSRGVIREALATLEVMRFIERRPNSGIYLRDTEVEGSFEALVLQAHLSISLLSFSLFFLFLSSLTFSPIFLFGGFQ